MKYVFVIGSPRSGTTWVQQMLSVHPSVGTSHESNLFQNYLGPMIQAWKTQNIPENWGGIIIGLGCYHSNEDFQRILRNLFMELTAPMRALTPENGYFVDNTPYHGAFIPEILTLIPDARFIHIIRKPEEVAASILRISRSAARYWAPKKARDALQCWVDPVEKILNTRDQVPSGNYCEVLFDEFHADPDAKLRRVYDFLNLSYDDGLIRKAVDLNTKEKMNANTGVEIPLGGEAAKAFGSRRILPRDFIGSVKTTTGLVDISLKHRIQLKYHIWRNRRIRSLSDELLSGKSPYLL